ncbi:MAG TPA: ABC transporter substrate-binding protein [Candidatus Binatia bacterium]|nr:ABC transporter substrate-binding protein [Candidatus Binatia bacterium]
MIRPLLFLLGVLILAPAGVVVAQGTKVPLVGYLSSLPRSAETARIESFRQGLRELGYSEGKDLHIEYRWAEGKFDRLPTLAADLLRLKPDVIVTGGPTATRPATEATSTIPVVMSFDSDPVGSGFVASLARPGGNVTGLSSPVNSSISCERLFLSSPEYLFWVLQRIQATHKL